MPARIFVLFLIFFASVVKGQSLPHTVHLDAGLLFGGVIYPAASIRIFNGIRFEDKKLETGLTVGLDIYKQLMILPATASLKWIPLAQRRLYPYLALNIGYGLPGFNQDTEEKEFTGGFLFNPSLGFRIKSGPKSRINLGLGFNHQKAGIHSKSFDSLGRKISETIEVYSFGRIALNCGIGF